MDQFRLSVIIPIYRLNSGNTLEYFRKLIESISLNIKNINSLSVFEIIIVNDSPEDYSETSVVNIFQEFQVGNLLKYYSNKSNRGQGYSRNFGAGQSSGDFLHFIDQDDYIFPDFYQNLKLGSQDLIMGDLWFNLNNKLLKKSYYKPWTKALLRNASSFQSLSFLLMSNIAVSPGQYIIKKNLFERVGKFPDLKNKGSDDFGFLFNLSLHKDDVRFSFVSCAKFIYRIHDSQGSKSLILNNSVNEFFDNHTDERCFSFSHKAIRFIRQSNRLGLFGMLFYLLFFNRAKF